MRERNARRSEESRSRENSAGRRKYGRGSRNTDSSYSGSRYNDEYDSDQDDFEYSDNRRSGTSSSVSGRRNSASDDRYYEEERRSRRNREYADDRRSTRDRDYEDDRRSRRDRDYEDDRRSRRGRDYEDDRRSRRGRDYEDDRRSREYENRRRRGADDRYYDAEWDRDERKKGGCLGCLMPLVVFIAALAGIIFLIVSILWGQVQKPGFGASDIQTNSDLPASVQEEAENYWSVMLYGVDSRSQDPLESGALSDANILVTINKLTGEITMTSIYRDTYVETTDGSHMKLTDVYSSYGVKESLQTINRNFDLNVTNFITVTWASVANAINGLGGLDLEITAAEAEGINDYIDEVINNTGISSEHVSEDISSDGETVHLDGVQAVTYCRLRKGLGDDYQRTVRQRTVISAAFAKAKSNPLAAATTAYMVLPEIASDLSTVKLLSMAAGLVRYNMGENYGFPQDKGDDGSYVFADTLSSNCQWLHKTVYGNTDYTPSDTVKRISEETASYSGYHGN